ncbi:hypothetical protein Tco_0815164 [Tanacetum coccineum]
METKYILRVLRIILVILQNIRVNEGFSQMEDGNPARANIKQALGRYSSQVHKMVIPLQDDVRLCLGDDLKKAQDHNQRQV